jgi:hypothetical protein
MATRQRATPLGTLSAPRNRALAGVAPNISTAEWFRVRWRLPSSDATGPSRHLLSNVDYTSRKRRPGRNQKRRLLLRRMVGGLLSELIGPFAGVVLRGLDLLSSLASQDADEAADRVCACRPPIAAMRNNRRSAPTRPLLRPAVLASEIHKDNPSITRNNPSCAVSSHQRGGDGTRPARRRQPHRCTSRSCGDSYRGDPCRCDPRI